MDVERTDKPQISVIVPIYNVEKYLRKCLDSLKYQTMKQIEVICIDDGSTDNSGRIADEYQNDGWPRFRVIHTENRGLSAARNRGIDESKADGLMFVDSDDWVDELFCRIPYNAAIENKVDIVIFGFIEVTKGKTSFKCNDNRFGIIDEFTAHEYGEGFVWNKLYEKTLFQTIRYPLGHSYEDLATTHKVVHEAKNFLGYRMDYIFMPNV